MNKENIIKIGRELVAKNGPDFLTVRKLSSASKTSVGLIYGLFANIDNFINQQNNLTLKELYEALAKMPKSPDSYKDLNNAVDVFSNFIEQNQNLWKLLGKSLSWQSSKQIAQVISLIDKDFALLFVEMPIKKRKLAVRLIIISIFSVSHILLGNPQEIKVLLNTYLAGLKVLEYA